MEAVFLSDLHLRSPQERNGEILLRFLLSLRGNARDLRIFLLGDIFDLWVSDHAVFVDRWADLLGALRELREAGAKIIYFEGNHDLHLAPYWRDVLGAEVHVKPAFFDLGGRRLRCEHGDEINREDVDYLRLRAFLRTPFIEMLGHKLPGRFWDAFGRRWSKHSRKTSSANMEARADRIRSMIRAHAERVWDDDPFDVIVTGHMHVVDDWTFERGGRSVRSINLGSWFDEPRFLVFENGKLEWRTL